ncbi:transcriptional regulator [Amycolatopsis albispora]|uniref:transcriptional regulator n=1 Tax=Amycolatopsis albispora TaxID=1804986 RepID=UPI000DE46B46|nr:transcriptional regulator [Amycolatopsis albispora]
MAGPERERLRERLARAGLLATAGQPRRRPDADAVAAAGREAVAGTSMADLVGEGRGQR